MKAGKKASKLAQRRTKRHQEGIDARKKRGVSEPERGYTFPGSMNSHKT